MGYRSPVNLQLFPVERRWKEGMEFECDGFRWRTVSGRHESPDEFGRDIKLEHRNYAGLWVPTKMALGLMLVDFYAENESDIHPQANGKQGGAKYLDACRHASRQGWEKAAARIEYDRAAKRSP